MFQEKRRTPRIPFVAVAELAEMESGTNLTGQVSELSAYGCYVEIHEYAGDRHDRDDQDFR